MLDGTMLFSMVSPSGEVECQTETKIMQNKRVHMRVKLSVRYVVVSGTLFRIWLAMTGVFYMVLDSENKYIRPSLREPRNPTHTET